MPAELGSFRISKVTSRTTSSSRHSSTHQPHPCGACGCDPETGDGAGILIQIRAASSLASPNGWAFTLPAAGEYGVGMTFLAGGKASPPAVRRCHRAHRPRRGAHRPRLARYPIDASSIGRVARGSQPYIQQIFLGRAPRMNEDQLERCLYIVRKRIESEMTDAYIPSLSCRTIVYKGCYWPADRQLLPRTARTRKW